MAAADATARGMAGLVQAPANIHIACGGITSYFGVVMQWIERCLHALHYTTDPSQPPQQRIGIFAHGSADAWIADAAAVPYIAIATEQPRHDTFARQGNRTWFTHAVCVWCMDSTDLQFIREQYGVPDARLCVLPCLLSTFREGVQCPADALLPTAIVHLGCVNAHRRGVLNNIQQRLDALPDTPLRLESYETLFDEPARSQMMHNARVLVIPNFYPPPCVPTWHRIAYALHVRHPQLRIIAEACDDGAVSTPLLAALAPLVRTCTGDELAAAAVAAAQEEPWSDEAVAEHAARIQRLFAHVLAVPRAGTSWLPEEAKVLARTRARAPAPATKPAPAPALPRSLVCLVMIVKNESAVIERCLHSVMPHVAAWCIADTGSSDDTKAKIAAVAAAHNKSSVGTVIDTIWRDFGSNRTEVLHAARAFAPHCRWHLMMDADDDVCWSAEADAALCAAPDNVPGFRVKLESGPTMTHYRTQVFAARLRWVYVGVLHEYPALADAAGVIVDAPTLSILPGALIHARAEGARSRNPHKYRDDALLLERELERHPNDARALFYCAQSWRDAGEPARAVELYRRVAASPASWTEERYIACLNVVRLCDASDVVQSHAFQAVSLNRERREVTTAWLKRTRAETGTGWTPAMLALGVLMMTTTPDVPKPQWLFIEHDVYTWRAGDEVALCAFYHGHMQLARELFTNILPRVPVHERARTFTNIQLCG